MSLTNLPYDDGVLVLRGEGEIDAYAAPALMSDLSALVAGATAVVLDLTDVSFFDSAGVRLIDQLARCCAAADAPFRVASPIGSLSRRVLEIVGLAGTLADDDLASALVRVRDR